MDERRQATTLADLETLDRAEMAEGYSDGFSGWPCGDNRSRSYYHGWQNGVNDKAGTTTPSMYGLARELRNVAAD